MVRDVVVRDILAKQAGLLHPVNVLAPVAARELTPCAMHLVANPGETLTVCHSGPGWRSPAVGGNEPRRPVFRKDHVGGGERHDRQVLAERPEARKGQLEGAPGKPVVMLDSGDAFFLK